MLRVFGGTLYAGGADRHRWRKPQPVGCLVSVLADPDARIATTGAIAGDNVYNTTGKGQLQTRTIARNSSGTFSLNLSNDRFSADTFQIKGPGSASEFTVQYLSGTTDITATVVAGTYKILSLPGGGNRVITLKVTVASSVRIGAVHTWLVTQKSQWSGLTDAVKAKVKVG